MNVAKNTKGVALISKQQHAASHQTRLSRNERCGIRRECRMGISMYRAPATAP